jgi:hypothetical protein
MNAEVIVNLIITGIIAVVPSAKDSDLIRLIAPSAQHASHHTQMDAAALAAVKKLNLAECRKQLAGCRLEEGAVPPHFAYLDVDARNVVPGDRREDFRYVDPADDSVHLVFLLRSEKVEFANAHSNTKLVRAGADAASSSAGASVLKITEVCPECRDIDERYFDILKHPDKSSMRMDFRGGTESVHQVAPRQVNVVGGTALAPKLVAELRYQFVVPACGQRLLLTRQLPGGQEPRTASISLVSNDGRPIDVRLGNTPMHNIVRSISDAFPEAGGDHFDLFYDMYTPSPAKRPKLAFDFSSGVVVGSRVPCLVTQAPAQDPAP